MTQPANITQFWQDFLHSLPMGVEPPPAVFEVWHFCDNQPDADALVELARQGIKTATASALWAYTESEPIPQVGSLSVITNWEGSPLLLVETTEVETIPFDQVGPRQAYDEGEGDRSLAYWRAVHWEVFGRDLRALGKEPTEEMPVICEHFKVLYRA